jgi:hypothetical protein
MPKKYNIRKILILLKLLQKNCKKMLVFFKKLLVKENLKTINIKSKRNFKNSNKKKQNNSPYEDSIKAFTKKEDKS